MLADVRALSCQSSFSLFFKIIDQPDNSSINRMCKQMVYDVRDARYLSRLLAQKPTCGHKIEVLDDRAEKGIHRPVREALREQQCLSLFSDSPI